MATADDEGFLTIIDRKKDMIAIGGFNVFPREVENVLSAHPGISEAAVIGVPDPDWGKAVRALVVRRPDATVGEAKLIRLSKSTTAPPPPRSMLSSSTPSHYPAGQARQEGTAGDLLGGREQAVN